tara:strand:+ start:123 stop:431 length:309 start_codon:yes stop_codon:yes gene_type:complete
VFAEDIYSCRQLQKTQLTGIWDYDERTINQPIIFIVKGKDLYRDIGAKELRAYSAVSGSSENIVKGDWHDFRWQLNTIDKIAINIYRKNLNTPQRVYKCEKK